MANQNKLDRLLAKAQKAYQRGDKHKGARLIEQILQQDFTHPGAWALLHRLYGPGRLFEEFQHSFTLQYYPDKLALLEGPSAEAEPTIETLEPKPETPEPTSETLEPTPETPEPQPETIVPPPKKPSFFARLFRRFRPQPPSPESAPQPGELTPEMAAAATAPTKPSATPAHKTSGMSLLQSAPQRDKAVPSAQPYPSPQSTGHEGGRPGILASAQPLQPAATLPGAQPVSVIPKPSGDKQKIQVVVVDDIPQTRETVIRSLRFQEHIEVIGTATNGVQAIQLVQDVHPDVVLMDVNMPDMDGITATAEIKRLVPQVQIIILTVQDDIDYMRKAMMAGARDFLAKPPRIEELVEAVLKAGELAKKEKAKAPPVVVAPSLAAPPSTGRIISIYSPRGGSGCTTLASNLAVTLNNEDTRVMLVDGNLQFGDVPVFFDVQSKNSIVDLAPRAAELDQEIVEEVVIKHSTGVRILSPSRPERAELVTGPHFGQLIAYLGQLYPYVIIDTAHRLTDVTLAALDASDLIVLVTMQDVPSIARMRKFFDLVPLLKLDMRRLMLMMNKFDQRVGITPEKVGQAFNQKMAAVLPLAPEIVIPSVNRGVPFMLEKDMGGRPLGRAMLSFSSAVRQHLNELKDIPLATAAAAKPTPASQDPNWR
jgi:pilus assembly protein CpaE